MNVNPYESAAHDLLDKHFTPVLLMLGTEQKAFVAQHQDDPLTHAEIARRFNGRDYNVGIACGAPHATSAKVLGVVFETRSSFGRLLMTIPRSPMIASRGDEMYAYYRLLVGQAVPNAIELQGEQLMLASAGKFLPAPPSYNRETDQRCEWLAGPVDAHELPFFPIELATPKCSAQSLPHPSESIPELRPVPADTVVALAKLLHEVYLARECQGQPADIHTHLCAATKTVETLASVCDLKLQHAWTITRFAMTLRKKGLSDD